MAEHPICSAICLQPIASTITACLTPVNDLLRESVDSCLFLTSNRSSLDKSLDELEAMADKFKTIVKEEETQMRICSPDVREWLNKVEEVVNCAKPLFVNDQPTDGDSQHGMCTRCNTIPFRDFCIGRKVTRALQDVSGLLEKGRLFTPPFTLPPPLEAVQPMVIPELTHTNAMDQVWSQFNDEHTSVVGLYGLGGVGKTTLLKWFNNELRKRNPGYQFQVVIILEVANAKTLDVVGMQRIISKRLGLLWNEGESDVNRAAFLLQALTQKKFVVLLDDVWEKFKLEDVGIPIPHPKGNRSKLIVSSRRDSVCFDMGAERPIEMHCLQEDESWKLFLSKLTENVRAMVLADDDVKKCAVDIVENCGGLPLAIDVIGSTLKVSDIRQTWYHVAIAIKQNPSSIEGVDQMLTVLKYSYDRLEETEKKCFLYCTMFPDYGSIHNEQLVDYWEAEGLISSEPYKGYSIISKLLSTCLLQRSDTDPNSEVKMHQMIRIMGRQQAPAENKLLINAGQGLEQAPDTKEWEDATRISLMSNCIKELSISPNCSKLLTLLLQNNPNLCQLCPKFFNFMPALKVLDLSHTAISVLPDCSSLVQLVYLNLSHTPIKKIPRQLCNTLLGLQYLNMSHTGITELPQQLAKLKNLTHLNLRETSALEVIPHGTISRLLKLKVLNLYKSNYGVKDLPDLNRHGIISRLFNLKVLNHNKSNNGVKDLPDLNLEGLRQLTYLGITIYSQQDFCKLTKSNPLARCIHLLSLSRILGVASIQLSEFKTMSHLTEMHMESCDDLEELIIDCNDEDDSMKKVKVLTLINLPKLIKVSGGSEMHQFKNLRNLNIHECPKLVDASSLLQIKSLQRIVITDCDGLKQLRPKPPPPPAPPSPPAPPPPPARVATVVALAALLPCHRRTSSAPAASIASVIAHTMLQPRHHRTGSAPPLRRSPTSVAAPAMPSPPWLSPLPPPKLEPPKPEPRPPSKPKLEPMPPPRPKSAPSPKPTTLDPGIEAEPAALDPLNEAELARYVNEAALDPRIKAKPAAYIDEAALDPEIEVVLDLLTEVEPAGYVDKVSHMTTSLKQFPCLESIIVDKCPNLTELPESQMCPNLKLICGEGSWWETIAPEVKAKFGDLFLPIDFRPN